MLHSLLSGGCARGHRALGGRVAACALAAAAALATPGAALGAPRGSSFSCRASAARIALTGAPTIEPFVANAAEKPCRSDHAGVLAPTTVGPLRVDAVTATTTQKPATLGAAPLVNGDHATSSTSLTNPTLGLAELSVHASLLSADASYTCEAGRALPSSSGSVVGLTINGNAVTVPPGVNQTVSLGPLGTLTLNQVIVGRGTITRRAISLSSPLGSVVLGEARVDVSGNPCARIPGRARLVIAPPASARAIAGGRCVRMFTARVIGREIGRVAFYIDGREIAIRSRSPYQVSIDAKPGRHRLAARVTFTSASGTRPRLLTLRFTGCSAPPAFTG